MNEIEQYTDKLKKYLLEEKIFRNEREIVLFFLNGGCNIYCKLIKKIFKEARTYINIEKSHVGVFLNNEVYDIRGKVYSANFSKTNIIDKINIRFNFGFLYYSKRKEKELIKKILKSNLEQKLDIRIPEFVIEQLYEKENKKISLRETINLILGGRNEKI